MMTLKPMRHDPSTNPKLHAALEYYEASRTGPADLSELRAKLIHELPDKTHPLSSMRHQGPSPTLSHTIKVLLLAALYTGFGYYIAQPQQSSSNQADNARKVDALTTPAPSRRKEDSKQSPQQKKHTAKPQKLEPHTKINSENNQKRTHLSSRHLAPVRAPGTLHAQILLFERIKAAIDQKRYSAAELESILYLSTYQEGAFKKDISTLRQQMLSTPLSARAIASAPAPSHDFNETQRQLFLSGIAHAKQTISRENQLKETP